MDLRVLHVLCDLSGGGAERLVLELCRRTPGAEVAVVQEGGALVGAFESAGVPVHRARRRAGRAGIAALARLATLSRGFDVVHTHLWAGDTWGRPAAWLAGVPVRVSTAHNVDRDEPAWKRRVDAASSRLVQRVVAVSDAVADWIVEHGVPRSRVSVIPNGIDLERFRAPHQGGAGVLAIGRLVPQKGFDVLLAAMRGLEAVPLTIAGEEPLRAQLEATAPEGARLVGLVEDLPSRLAAADLVVIPSRWEGFGLVAVEAMAAGVPVIAADVDGLREVVGDAALLVPPDDPAALASAIARLLAEPGRRAYLSDRGRRRAESFSIDRTVRRYAELYDRLADAPPLRRGHG